MGDRRRQIRAADAKKRRRNRIALSGQGQQEEVFLDHDYYWHMSRPTCDDSIDRVPVCGRFIKQWKLQCSGANCDHFSYNICVWESPHPSIRRAVQQWCNHRLVHLLHNCRWCHDKHIWASSLANSNCEFDCTSLSINTEYSITI